MTNHPFVSDGPLVTRQDFLPGDVGSQLRETVATMYGGVGEIRRRVRAGELTRASLRPIAEDCLPTGTLAGNGVVVSRIIDLALDALLSESLAPELRLLPQAVTLPDLPIHALVFTAFPHVLNELYPLLVDAYVAGAACQVIGVHADWLADGRVRRAIFFDEATQGICEADLRTRPDIASAQVLALNLARETADHRRVEEAISGRPLTNPLAGAERLDDKAWTARVWEGRSLPTPAFVTLPTTPDVLAAFQQHFGTRVVIKPTGGTEGSGVMFADLSAIDPASLLTQEDMLITRERGTLRYGSAHGPVRCTLRLNACWDGAQAQVESGYAQIADAPDGIASAGRGGHIIPLPELWNRLCHADGRPVRPTALDWRRILSAVRAGVAVLAGTLGDAMPALVGIDVLLDAGDQDAVIPLLLEANPRPAGMGHSRFITPDGPTDEPGVTAHLWQVVAAKQESRGE